MTDMERWSIPGRIVDIHQKKVFQGRLVIENDHIVAVEEGDFGGDAFILPGFIDAHVHIESSMLLPSEFARLAVVHGTVGSVSDPHEIANVLGIDGVRFMIENGRKVPFHFYFGAPSCVPATPFETAGASLDVTDVVTLLEMPEIRYLSEMMNFPGVLGGDPAVMAKIAAARERGKPVDGHAPGLLGDAAKAYAAAGISTDHECFTIEEGRDKIQAGMKVLIREGSAARNFDALVPLLHEEPGMVMFCSDDKHPDELVKGHINQLVSRAVKQGFPLFDVLRAATLNPVEHYGLDAGLLRTGDRADFIVVKDLQDFQVLATYIAGEKVAEAGRTLIPHHPESTPNQFNARRLKQDDLRITDKGLDIKVIEAYDGQLITGRKDVRPLVKDGLICSDTDRDILKMLVLNRYEPALPALDFVTRFGLKKGAIASTVAHDSHNIICVGTNDEDMVNAVNLLIGNRGGIVLVNGEEIHLLPLPVAGIMSDQDGYEVAAKYEKIDHRVKELGSTLNAPFMTLSFMALLVIPALKLSDKGLFDGNTFQFTEIFSH